MKTNGKRKKKLKVLFIEDDVMLLKVVKGFMRQEMVEMHEAHDGKAGLEMAREIRPDVIVLDLDMPVMNGFDVLREVRDDKDLRGTPVLVLTNLSSAEGIKLCEVLGAVGYLMKPEMDFRDVVRRIQDASAKKTDVTPPSAPSSK